MAFSYLENIHFTNPTNYIAHLYCDSTIMF
jgi:hypothetical protein